MILLAGLMTNNIWRLMKNYLSLLLAVAAVFCISCTKELDNQNLKAPSNSHVVFKARVSNNPMSKATITPNGDDTVFSSAWEGTDAVNLYAVSTSFDEEARADWNPSTQAFEGDFISSAPTVKEEWMYEAKYPYDDDGNIPFGSVRVQKGNTYNSAYDIMYGTVNYTDAFLGQDNSGNVFVIPMTRLTGIAYFHITGGSSSDDVLSATLTVNSGNIAAETVAINGSGDAVVPTNGTNSITINFPSGYRPKANDIKLWFNVIPGEYSGLKLTINTATQTAVLNSTKTLTYTAGELNKAVLSNLKWNDKVNVYSKVTEAPTDWSGTYLIVYEDGSLAFDGSLETLDATSNTIAVTISDNKIVSDATTNASAFTIAVNDDGYSICSASGKYIGQNSDANGLATNNSPIKNTISISEDNADIVSGGAYLRYNSASNQLRFRYYKSASYTGQKAIQLYKLEDNRTDPGMIWSASSASATIDDGDVITFTPPTLTAGHATGITYNSTDSDVATISNAGEVTILAGGTTTIQAIFAGDTNYKPQTIGYTLTVTDNRTPSTPTIADILAGGAGSYTVNNLLVYAVNGKNAIVGDSTGKMLLFMEGHGLTVGDNISIPSATVTLYSNTTLEITAGTINTNSAGNAVDHGTAVNLNDATAASSTHTNFSASGNHSAVYVSMTGSQSGQNITGSNPNTTLHLNVANAATDGKTVNVTGYVYSWSSSFSNYNFQAITIAEDTTTPTLNVTPTSLNWDASSTESKTITVTVNGSATGYSVSPATDSNWNISDDGNGTVTVSPKAANASTSDAKTITLTITHNDETTLHEDVTLTQAKAANVGFTPFNVWEDDFSGCSNSSSALSSLSGSTSGFTGSYSGISNTYPMDDAIRVGKASAAGSITTPVLTTIDGSAADLTVTFKAAGWNGKTAKITLSVNKGSVTEGQTTITSESSMQGNSPSMNGSSYTFHITGADNTTKITFTTTNSIGIDDLVITQTAN